MQGVGTLQIFIIYHPVVEHVIFHIQFLLNYLTSIKTNKIL